MSADAGKRLVGRREFLVGSASALVVAGLAGVPVNGAGAQANSSVSSPMSLDSWELGPDVTETTFNTCDCDFGLVRQGGVIRVQTAWWPNWRRYEGSTMDNVIQLPDATRDSSFTEPHGDDAYWSGGIWADEQGTWYATVHVEYDYATPYSYPHWTRRVGVATSSDLGANWHYVGDILTTSPNAPKPDPTFSDFGDGDHRLFVDERHGYAYLYFWRGWSSPTDGVLYDPYVAVARCSLADRLLPGSWTKWYEGSWSQPGLEGLDSEVIPGATAQLGVHYNTYLRQYVVIDTSGVWTATDLTSQNWSRRGEFPNRLLYYNTPIDPFTWERWEIGRYLRHYSSQTDVDNVDSKYMTVTLNPAPISIPLSASYNDGGISEDGSQVPADFDGGHSSFSQEALTAAGFGPGAAVTVDGCQYLMPNVPAGQPDNTVPTGQIIEVPYVAGATKIGFLGAAANGDASGYVVITYRDGSRQSAPLALSDWTLNGGTEALLSSEVVAATMPYRNIPLGGAQQLSIYLFSSVPIPLQAGKVPARVTLLPTVNGGQLHLFAIGTDKGPLSS